MNPNIFTDLSESYHRINALNIKAKHLLQNRAIKKLDH